MTKTFPNILLVYLLCLAASGVQASGPGNKAPVVRRMLELYHGCPPTFDDKLCEVILDDYLRYLDPDAMYFTAPDIQQIKNTTDVKAGMQGHDAKFLNTIITLYRERLMWADTLINTVLEKPFDFTGKDNIILGTDSTPYAPNDNELKQRWNKLLKYETLHRVTDISMYDSTATKDYMLQQQRGEEKTVLKTEERRIKKVLNNPAGYENYLNNLFCNILASVYDPHSEFFPITEKENFEGAVNGGGYSFGIDLGENDKREVEITHITPGSPAWKSGQLNQNDVLLQMQWEGDPVIDLAGADAEETEQMLEADNHRLLNLTVHKADGFTVTVKLRKEKLEPEEDFVKNYILNGEYKIGYILLPGFYTEWENNPRGSCANDVARGVLKLKNENIRGLILDLRNNGGGSMEEAMELAGIFIDEGVLGFTREKTDRPHALKDPNRGTIYDGPLLVLVNGESASASEFVAGALQDYNRAIIAGSPTFGKATYQSVLPCDTTINLEKASAATLNNSKNYYIKITLGKLYRVTGKSNQLKGVQPDILLPDAFAAYAEHESSMKHALLPDTVKRAIYFKQLPPLPVNALAAKSKERITGSHGFGLVLQAGELYREMRDLKAGPIPLAFDPFLSLAKKFGKGGMTLYHELQQDSVRSFNVENFGADKARIALGGYEAEVNARVLSAIRHDIYINESFSILADYIKVTK